MPQLTQSEIGNNTFAFVDEWKDESRESAESQSFWNKFFTIFGINRRLVATIEKAVKKSNENKESIDVFWKK